MSKVKEIKNLWGWLDEVMLHKSPIKDISEDSWKSFNIFMIHKFISMNPDYVQVANYIQQKSTLEPKQVYLIYRQTLPKVKVWSKYIKSTTLNQDGELVDKVSSYFECSKKEAAEYIEILGKEGSINVLSGMGVEEKEIKKLTKKLK